MDAWNLLSPYRAIGIYISGSSRYCGDQYQPNLSPSWVATNAANGWRFMPIHVGYQAPCFKNNPDSRVQKKRMSSTISTARAQARSDAAEAVAALKRYGFASRSVMYLDIEWYDRSKTSCDDVTRRFIDEWTQEIHAAGYLSGLYSSGSAAIKSVDEMRGVSWYDLPDHMWFAWTNKVASVYGGPYLSAAGWADHQRIHQYHNNVTVSYGGHRLTIDKDFLDVGKGAVISKEALPCGVRMSFSAYPSLKLGAERAEVSTLQCLLTKNGHATEVTGTFDAATRAALNDFRAAHGWAQNGYVNGVIWTSLLSYGQPPLVRKYGSVGDMVWRLQRALTAAGESVTINGYFDRQTAAAVKAYRVANGLGAYPTAEAKVWSALKRGLPG
jgi:hypothetical protein